MKIVNLIQGTPEWHAHRASHWNASDAPAMLGVSPYKNRATLLRELATGIGAEIDAATQRRFDDGHRFESLARPLAEQIVGEELYPCVGVEGRFSASFDGITLDDSTAFEHKTLNDSLRALQLRIEDGEQIGGANLPEHYRAQMEHQCMVSGAKRVLFMATLWDGEQLAEQLWCWYTPDPDLRARIVAGWAQFERDLADYQPVVDAPRPVPVPVAGFGSLSLRVEGRVLASNLDTFRAGAEAFIARLPKPAELQSDQDFVDADAAAKACADAEDRIAEAKRAALAQMTDVEAVMRTADEIAQAIRAARLALDKAVKTEKDNRKVALVRAGELAVVDHYTEVNATLGEFAIPRPAALSSTIAASIKGLKTLASMRAAIDAAVADAKIEASRNADRVRACAAQLPTDPALAVLFPDRVALCHSKAPEDLAMLVEHRIAEHEKQEARRIAEAEERGRQMAETAAQRQQATAPVPTPAPAVVTVAAGARIRLGEINALIAPLSISAEGLAQLGFPHVATDKAAKLYDAAQLSAMRQAMARVAAGMQEAA